MTFDVTKPVQTRDGRKARIICTDAKGLFPIIALLQGSAEEYPLSYRNTGREHLKEAPSDLVNIPAKRVEYRATTASLNHVGAASIIPREGALWQLKTTYLDDVPVSVELLKDGHEL